MGKKNLKYTVQTMKVLKSKGSNKSNIYMEGERRIAVYLSKIFDNSESFILPAEFNPNIFQTVLFALTDRKDATVFAILEQLAQEYVQQELFKTPRSRDFFKKGEIRKGSDEVVKTIYRLMPHMQLSVFQVYFQTLVVLFNYFDYKVYLDNKQDKGRSTLKSLLDYCYYITCSRTLRQVYYGNLKKQKKFEEIKNMDLKPYILHKYVNYDEEFDLKPEHISFNCSEDRKKEYALMFSNLFKAWRTEEGVGRNTKESLGLSDIVENWDLLLNPLEEDLFTMDNSEIWVDEKNDEKYSDIFSYFSEGIREYPIVCRFFESTVCQCILEIQLKEMFSLQAEQKSLLDLDIKTLKSTNRSLTKDMTKLKNSIDTLEKSMVEKDKKLAEIAEIEQESQELKTLKESFVQIEKDKQNISDELKKSLNKVSWQENHISELTHTLKYYESVESDLLGLQNENNFLKSKIEEIEKLESCENPKEEFEKKLKAIQDEPIMFIGGVGNMMSKFMTMFPNSEYIDISDTGLNFTIPSKIKYVAIYTRVVTHAHCERAESMVGKEKIIPLNIFNTQLVIDELYKNIVGHKN